MCTGEPVQHGDYNSNSGKCPGVQTVAPAFPKNVSSRLQLRLLCLILLLQLKFADAVCGMSVAAKIDVTVT